MMHPKRRAFALVIAAGFAVGGAGLLTAQTQDSTSTSEMGMTEHCPMMGAMAGGPASILRHAAELNLSSEQVSRLEHLRDGLQQAHHALMPRMGEIHQQIEAAIGGERFDEAATRAAFRRMAELHADMVIPSMRARQEARAVLSTEQREKLAGLVRTGMSDNHHMMHGMQSGSGMHGMGGMHQMMSMMANCPMMHGRMGHQREER